MKRVMTVKEVRFWWASQMMSEAVVAIHNDSHTHSMISTKRKLILLAHQFDTQSLFALLPNPILKIILSMSSNSIHFDIMCMLADNHKDCKLSRDCVTLVRIPNNRYFYWAIERKILDLVTK